MTPVGIYAWEGHHLAHLVPIWDALPVEARGAAIITRAIERRARQLGLTEYTVVPDRDRTHTVARRQITVVSAWGALRDLRGNRAVFTEHGAGQTYGGDPLAAGHTSYAGCDTRPGVILNLCPNERVADLNRAACPDIPAVVVGTPYLDRWHTAPAKPRGDKPTVCVSFHWACHVAPETLSAWTHYRQWFPEWAREQGYNLIGHAHPRIAKTLGAAWRAAGIPFVENWEDVLATADVYAVDNSSTLYEFASLDRPVVALNAPWFRPTVHHGLRFWDTVPGPQVAHGGELFDAVDWVLEASDPWRSPRRRVNDIVVPVRDGTAAQRAADAILEMAS